MKSHTVVRSAILMLLLVGTIPAIARIKLVALPSRERVEIQMENGRYTLVEEERTVPLLQSTAKAGNNRIDFSWSNTKIDKNSIRFRPIAIRDGDKFRPIKKIKGQGGKMIDEIGVINVSYPPNENALVWQVFAANGYAAKVRVSYLIRNFTRTFNYKALVTPDEKHMLLRKYIQLRNYSGEEFGGAAVWLGYGDKLKPLRTVGQQEEIKLLLYRFEKVPVKKTYTFDWYRYGRLSAEKPFASRVLMHYNMKNDKANKLGVIPMEPGKVRIFIQDKRGGEAFLGEDWGKLTPIGDEMKLFVGQARDVVCKRVVEVKDIVNKRQPLYDMNVVIKYEIENFKPEAVTVSIVEQLNRLVAQFSHNPHGNVEWTHGARTSNKMSISYENGRPSPTLHVKLPPRPKDKDVEKTTVQFHVTIKNLW